MKVNGIGNYKSINDFVKSKLSLFETKGKSFSSLFEVMFSEKENIMYEYSSGYRIIRKTYGEVYDEILRLSSGFKNQFPFLPDYSPVGIYMDNGIEWIEMFWALIACGYNPLLLNLRLDDGIINTVLKENNVPLVVSDGKEFDVRTVLFRDIVPAESSDSENRFGKEVLVMSSGTSRQIKVCSYTAEEFYYQICGSLEIIKECPQMKKHFGGELKQLTFLPFYHVFGLIAMYIWFAFFSRTFVGLSDMSPSTILNTIKRHKVTHIFAVPLFWDTVYKSAVETIKGRGDRVYGKFQRGMKIASRLQNVPFAGKLFSKAAFGEIRDNLFGDSIQFMISGGSSISPETLSFFNNIGYRLANGYGMTEIGITSVELSSKSRYLIGGYVGKPIKYSEYRISDDGELQVRGRATAKSITENGIRRENDSWYNTGDLVRCSGGHYFIISRKDDVVISSSGENVNPFFVEPRFAFEGIEETCLIKSFADGEERPVLLLKVGRNITPGEFTALSETVISKADEIRFPKDGRIFYTTAPLMKDGEFKLNRRRISEDFDACKIPLVNSDTISDSSESPDEIMDEVRILASGILNRDGKKIGPDDDLFISVGMTSLDYFALISGVNSRFNVKIMPNTESGCRTLRQICERVKESCGGAY